MMLLYYYINSETILGIKRGEPIFMCYDAKCPRNIQRLNNTAFKNVFVFVPIYSISLKVTLGQLFILRTFATCQKYAFPTSKLMPHISEVTLLLTGKRFSSFLVTQLIGMEAISREIILQHIVGESMIFSSFPQSMQPWGVLARKPTYRYLCWGRKSLWTGQIAILQVPIGRSKGDLNGEVIDE